MPTSAQPGYDVIGDVHGNADRLENLLLQVGYTHSDEGWRAPEGRQAIFVGDLIDRGEQQVETLRIVQAMCENGSAQMVMGNHEFNAIAYSAIDPESGDYCRIHSPKNRQQHEAFLAAVTFDSPPHHSIIEWFLTLPLWLDLGDIRVVHACWSATAMKALATESNSAHLTTDDVIAASRRNTPEYGAVETLLKGPEIGLHGHHYFDKGGIHRTKARAAWWDPSATDLRSAAVISEDTIVYDADGQPIEHLPPIPLDDGAIPVYDDARPVFVGHYWETGKHELKAPNVACVDYSAGNGGPLVAYRWNKNDSELSDQNFIAS